MSTSDELSPSLRAADVDLAEGLLAVHEATDSEQTVERVAEFACIALGCEAAGVMLVHARNRIETAAATGDAVGRAHDLQVELDEGPCLDALENHSESYVVTDTVGDTQWPRWAAQVAQLGFRSVLSVPLSTTERRYGSLNVYSTRPRAFDGDDLAVTQILGRHASLALAAARDVEGLQRAVDARKLIGMAMGIVMERYGIDADRAFGVLRRHSQDSNIKLREVARQVVDSASS